MHTAEHKEMPHLCGVTKRFTQEVTVLVHGEEALEKRLKHLQYYLENATADDFKIKTVKTFLGFNGAPQAEISRTELENGLILFRFE
jgi:tyrosyl-tRNA synthetase